MPRDSVERRRRPLAYAVAPAALGLRRLRARPLHGAGLAVAFAAAAGLLASTSVTAAVAHEENVRLRLAEEPPAGRSLQVVSRLLPFDEERPAVAATVDGFARVGEPVRRLRVWNPIMPADERGVRLVVPLNQAARREVAVSEGRLPGRCRRNVCEGLALAGPFRPGDVVRIGRNVRLRITGRALVSARALPDPADLGDRAVLVPAADGVLAPLLAEVGSGVSTTLVLDPEAVRGYEIEALAEGMRRAVVRIDRLDSLDDASAPLPLVEELAARGEASRGRLLLVAGQAAALILAFAAFAAAARRRDTQLLQEQLATFGATRPQALAARALETLVPAAVGTAVALGAILVAATVAGRRLELPGEFTAVALPAETVLAATVLAAVAALVIVVVSGGEAVRRRGVGPLDVAALAAVCVVVWQASATGALDPATVARTGGSSPVLLLVPALTFFASAVVLLRLLPLVFRLGERLARHSRFTLRLALLSATRSPAQAAATTTFLAVALGAALFSLNYRTTLDRQAHDEAHFRAGAAWRVAERSRVQTTAGTDVSPLTRFAELDDEPATPVLRLPARLHEVETASSGASLTLVGLPASRLPDVLGWRDDFSELTRAELARRLRPKPVRLEGPALGDDARALHLWGRARTARPRLAVLHVLDPAAHTFTRVTAGTLTKEWTRLRVVLPTSARGGQIVGIEFVALGPGDPFDPGYVDFGGIEVRGAGGRTRVEGLGAWVPAPGPFGPVAATETRGFPRGPIRRGIRFELNGSPVPLVRPPVELRVAAVVGPRVADAAVDERVTFDVPVAGISLRADVVGSARLFPTVVDDPEAFALVDYEALFAVLNVDLPGVAPPSEAWFFEEKPEAFGTALDRPPFRVEQVLAAERLERRLREDPVAAGARRALGLGALAAILLGLAGLVLATRTALRDERLLLAEYEALGVPPASLARSVQLRLAALSALGLAAGAAGGLVTIRLIGALVAVTASGTAPLPPIDPAVAWAANAAVLAAAAVVAAVAAAWLVARDLRRSAAARLRG